MSAWATFLFILVTFFFVQAFDGAANELDIRITQSTKAFARWLRSWLLGLDSDGGHLSLDTIEKIAFTLSDQQLVTGISIFVVGYARHCAMSQYHFYIAYLLGIASSSTHQSTVMILRNELRSHPWRKYWRYGGILVIFAFIFLASLLVYNDRFLYQLGFVIQCTWVSFRYTPSQAVQLTVTLFIILWSLATVTMDLFEGLDRYIKGKFKRLLELLDPIPHLLSPRTWHHATNARCDGAQSRVSKIAWTLLQLLTFLPFLLYFSAVQLQGSRLLDLIRIWATLFYATVSLQWIRSIASENGIDGHEDTWGFGQILPMLLLLLPLSQVWEMWCKFATG